MKIGGGRGVTAHNFYYSSVGSPLTEINVRSLKAGLNQTIKKLLAKISLVIFRQ